MHYIKEFNQLQVPALVLIKMFLDDSLHPLCRSTLYILLLLCTPWLLAISYQFCLVAMPLFAMRLFLFTIIWSPSAAIYNANPN